MHVHVGGVGTSRDSVGLNISLVRFISKECISFQHAMPWCSLRSFNVHSVYIEAEIGGHNAVWCVVQPTPAPLLEYKWSTL